MWSRFGVSTSQGGLSFAHSEPCQDAGPCQGRESLLADSEAPTVSGLLGAVAEVPCDMLTAGEAEWGLYGNSGTIFCNFSGNQKLF